MLFSSWTDDLTEKPKGQYKFGSAALVVDNKIQIVNRQTYGLLDWLGDIGGLYDAMFILLNIFLTPFL